ncbi:hypothetical protein KQI63_12360 [bacterium]|nr:hypothetical protein [bacterium]
MEPAQLDRHQTEYQMIQAERMALGQHLATWYRLGFTAAIAVLGFAIAAQLGEEVESSRKYLLVLGFIFAVAILIHCERNGHRLDRAIVRYYPRLVYLEIILGYDFYISYLTKRNDWVKRIVSSVKQSNKPEDKWNYIRVHLPETRFPEKKRGHNYYYLAIGIILSSYIVTICLFWINLI